MNTTSLNQPLVRGMYSPCLPPTEYQLAPVRRAGAASIAPLVDRNHQFDCFVYDRAYGLCEVPDPGDIMSVMACLFALRCGFADAAAMIAACKLGGLRELVETYLEFLPGVAYQVSVYDGVFAGHPDLISEEEWTLLGGSISYTAA